MALRLATPPVKSTRISIYKLFKSYLEIGLVAFGPAMAAEAKKSFVKNKNWIKESEFVDGLILGQLLPGATFVSLAVYIGYRIRGVWGAITSFIGFLLPPFLIMVVLSHLYFEFGSIDSFHMVVTGMGVVVTALVANAVLEIGQSAIKDIKGVVIALISLGTMYVFTNIFLVIILAAILGIVSYLKVVGSDRLDHDGLTQVDYEDSRTTWIGLVVFLGVVVSLLALNPILFNLFATFSKIAACVFGNGFTMIPVIQQEVVANNPWLTIDEFLVGIALGQMTPGPVLITATFVGYKVAGFYGAVAATLGMFLPSLLLVIGTAKAHKEIRRNRWVQSVFKGIVASFVGVMLLIAIGFTHHSITSFITAIIAITSFLILRLTGIQTPWVLVGGTSIYCLINMLVK